MITKTLRQIRWLGFVLLAASFPVAGNAQAPVGPEPGVGVASAPDISPGVAEVVKLAESGSSDDVMLAYIQSARSPYQLTADGVIYLKDLGLSSPVVTAMLTHDGAMGSQPPPYNYQQQLYPATKPVSAAQLSPPVNPEPAPAPASEDAPPPVYVNDAPAQVGYFYSDLAPYGAWVQLDGLGWCWQPSAVVVNHGWQPYCDGGHWVYTDAGWFWQSDYSWGWAPFHYGRWQLHERCGWVWLPDTVWAPAWVTWRLSVDACGWAPLPPRAEFDLRLGFRFNGLSVGANFDFGLGADRFTFIALKDFNEHDLAHRRLALAQSQAVFPRTTVLHNYTVANNNLVVNHGVPVERVAAVTHVQIRQTTIRDLPAGTARPVRIGAANRTEAVVYRPQLKSPPKAVAMVAQQVDERHPVVEHRPITTLTAEKQPAPAGGGSFEPGAAVRQPQPQGRNPAIRDDGQRGMPATPGRGSPGTRQPAAPALPQPNQPNQPVQPDRGPRASNSPGPRQANSGAGAVASGNPQVYYPKSYYQASAIRATQPAPQSPASPDAGIDGGSRQAGRSGAGR